MDTRGTEGDQYFEGQLVTDWKSIELNRLVLWKENMRGQKTQAVELCLLLHTGSRWRSIPAPGENLVLWAKLQSHTVPQDDTSWNIPPKKHKHQQGKHFSGHSRTTEQAACKITEDLQILFYCPWHWVCPCFTVMDKCSFSSFLSFLPCLLPTNADREA